jgi:hypothetical protein
VRNFSDFGNYNEIQWAHYYPQVDLCVCVCVVGRAFLVRLAFPSALLASLLSSVFVMQCSVFRSTLLVQQKYVLRFPVLVSCTGRYGIVYDVVTEASANVFTAWRNCLYRICSVDGVVTFFPHIVTDCFCQYIAKVRTPYIRARKAWNACGYVSDFLCNNAAVGVEHCFTLRFAACGALKPRWTPCFVVNWLIADVSLWLSCVDWMYLTVHWPLCLTRGVL